MYLFGFEFLNKIMYEIRFVYALLSLLGYGLFIKRLNGCLFPRDGHCWVVY